MIRALPLLILWGALLLCSCSSSSYTSRTSACDDPLYLTLQHRKLDSLTDREYSYLQEKSRECAACKAQAGASEVSDALIITSMVGAFTTYVLFVVRPR